MSVMVSASLATGASSRTILQPFDFARDRQAPHATARDKQDNKVITVQAALNGLVLTANKK